MEAYLPTDIIIYHIIPYVPMAMLYVSKATNIAAKHLIDKYKLLDFPEDSFDYVDFGLSEICDVSTANRLLCKIIMAFGYGDVVNAVRMMSILDEIVYLSWFDILVLSSFISDSGLNTVRRYINTYQRLMSTSLNPRIIYSHIKHISNRFHKEDLLANRKSRLSAHTLWELTKLENMHLVPITREYIMELQDYVSDDNMKYLPVLNKLFGIDKYDWFNNDRFYKFLTLDALHARYTNMIANTDDISMGELKIAIHIFPNENWGVYWGNLEAIRGSNLADVYRSLYKIAPFTSYSQLGGFPTDRSMCNCILYGLYNMDKILFVNGIKHLFHIPLIRQILISRGYSEIIWLLNREDIIDLICVLEPHLLSYDLIIRLDITNEIIAEVAKRSPIIAQSIIDTLEPIPTISLLFE